MGYSPWGCKESDMTEQLTQYNQWLGLCVLTTKGPDLLLGWGIKIPQAMWHNPTQMWHNKTHTYTTIKSLLSRTNLYPFCHNQAAALLLMA